MIKTTSGLIAGALALLILPGCAENTQYKGKLFGMVRGITGKKVKADPYVEARAPLVVPPSRQLAAPKNEKNTQIATNWPKDPELRAKALAKARKEKILEDERSGSIKGKSHKKIWEEMEEGHSRGLFDRLFDGF